MYTAVLHFFLQLSPAEFRRGCLGRPSEVEEDDGTFMTKLGVNVRSKLREGFIDNLLLVEMQLMATLIKHHDPVLTKKKKKKQWEKKKKETTTKEEKKKNIAALDRIGDATRQVCREVCPRLLGLSTSLLNARVRDIMVVLAEASAIERGSGNHDDIEVSYHCTVHWEVRAVGDDVPTPPPPNPLVELPFKSDSVEKRCRSHRRMPCHYLVISWKRLT